MCFDKSLTLFDHEGPLVNQSNTSRNSLVPNERQHTSATPFIDTYMPHNASMG